MFDQAKAAAPSNPELALRALEEADRLVDQALTLANQQRDNFPWNGPQSRGGSGLDLGALILGGILNEAMRGGSRGRSWGGSRGPIRGPRSGGLGRGGGFGGGRRGGFGGRF